MAGLLNALVSLLLLVTGASCFVVPGDGSRTRNFSVLYEGLDDDVEIAPPSSSRVERLKRDMLEMGASFDRGFGASPRAREKAKQIISDLESENQEMNAARHISGNPSTNDEASPLTGRWRLIWTTATDVLGLGASPIATVGAIYQFFDPPIVTNVIDFLPRIQNLLPPPLVQNSMPRAQVQTRASPREGMPNRVGLDFERVELKPVELLGQDVGNFLPPFGFDLPKLFEVPDDVGYFDVTFLDDDFLVIQQNAPGGLFVLARVEDSGP